MKKIIAMMLAVLMAFGLCACAEELQGIELPPLPEVTPTPPPTFPSAEDPSPSPNEESPVPTTGVMPTGEPEDAPAMIFIQIGNRTIQQYDPAEQKELILTFSYDMPRIYAEELPEAAARINESLATVEETFYTGSSYEGQVGYPGFSTMLEAAEDNYTYVYETGGSGLPLELTDTLSAQVRLLSEDVLSIIYAETNYMGGAHGSYGATAYVFDMRSGEPLSLDRLSEDSDGLRDYLTGELLALYQADEDGYYSERISEDFLPEGGIEEALRALLRDGSWYLDREGMRIFSDLYELGPYAAGVVEFEIPYERLAEHVDARWLYPGARQGKGKLSVVELTDEGCEKEIVDKLTVNEDGQELCVLVDGRIYDVSVETVYYLDRFYENAQLWYANTLSDCALQLQVVVPEGLPDLRISYTTADGERHGKLLSQSGLDGGYMLVDDNIEAVG